MHDTKGGTTATWRRDPTRALSDRDNRPGSCGLAVNGELQCADGDEDPAWDPEGEGNDGETGDACGLSWSFLVIMGGDRRGAPGAEPVSGEPVDLGLVGECF